ncbi:MAG: UvrB/UvrC motif-containing protein [Planctomycetota bacterium]
MTLDLDEVISGWDCPPGELRARLVTGRDGGECLQLRIDLGVMQMALTDRPDGARCHGLPTTRACIEHELRVGGAGLTPEHWAELDRELLQTNYRRMAYAAVADGALQEGNEAQARQCLAGALADIETCLATLRLLTAHSPQAQTAEHSPQTQPYASLQPTLLFDRARLSTQLRIVEGRFEEAIEYAEAGAAQLDELLAGLGCDEEQRAEDGGLRYLRELGRQLRQEYGITETLAEQLSEAIANEDFETAARLRDQLKRRPKPA